MATIHRLLTSNLARLVERFSAATEESKSTIGLKALNDHKWVGRVLAGANFSVSSYDRVVGYLALHWPSGVDWPETIPRPSLSEASAGKKNEPALAAGVTGQLSP